MKRVFFFGVLFFTAMLFAGCKDLEDFPLPDDNIHQEGETAGIYVLCEGLYAQNSSSLAYYNFKDNYLVRDVFLSTNGRKLGDTANDMQQYGSKIYVVVDNSGTIEVLDAKTSQSVKKIQIRNERNLNRHPRYIAFHEGKAYAACFDSTVCRIDTATLQVETVAKAGAYPDGICVANNKIYVSNSGDREFSSLGNTVSVIDIPTFTKIKEITVASNPYRIMPDSRGNVYLASRGNYKGSGPYVFQKIDTQTDEVVKTFDQIEALNFTIVNDTAYIYHYDFEKQVNTIKTFDCLTDKIVEDKFIKDNTQISTPYAIVVNPKTGDVYITDAGSFTTTGDLYCFGRDGICKFRIRDIGLNPNAVIFTYQKETSSIPVQAINHVTKVIDFHPAPGQFNGSGYLPLGKTIETVTYDDILAGVSAILTDSAASKGVVSLGAWGGYITLGFDEPIKNIQGEYDFKVYGNAYYHTMFDGIGGSCEPGIVLVSKDVNGNGLADDDWYELAGSEYNNPGTIHGYEITYLKPDPVDGDIPWVDNQGNGGYVKRNEYHKQLSYYPLWEQQESLTFRGARLPDNGKVEGNTFVLYAYAYGYADNRPNDSDLSAFDLSWAVDSEGNGVELDEVNFIRIYSAVNQYHGTVGEISTEVAGVENLHK